jgi:metallo-beta-lactamase class B
VGQYCFDAYYPGEGHTKDNIVIWFEKEKILYGGCLVKSVENDDIGFIGDANLTAWPKTMENLINKYHQPAYVIPGHFGWADNKSLEHTLLVVKNKLNH